MSRRAVATLAAVGLMLVGPAWAEAGRGQLPFSPPWQMFDAVGRDHCLLELSDGVRPVDRYRPFGAEGWWDAPMEVTWISNMDHAQTLAHALCDAEAAERIEVVLRCPAPHGWGAERATVVCSGASPPG